MRIVDDTMKHRRTVGRGGSLLVRTSHGGCGIACSPSAGCGRLVPRNPKKGSVATPEHILTRVALIERRADGKRTRQSTCVASWRTIAEISWPQKVNGILLVHLVAFSGRRQSCDPFEPKNRRAHGAVIAIVSIAINHKGERRSCSGASPPMPRPVLA